MLLVVTGMHRGQQCHGLKRLGAGIHNFLTGSCKCLTEEIWLLGILIAGLNSAKMGWFEPGFFIFEKCPDSRQEHFPTG